MTPDVETAEAESGRSSHLLHDVLVMPRQLVRSSLQAI